MDMSKELKLYLLRIIAYDGIWDDYDKEFSTPDELIQMIKDYKPGDISIQEEVLEFSKKLYEDIL